MKRLLLISFLIYFFITPCSSQAFFARKSHGQDFNKENIIQISDIVQENTFTYPPTKNYKKALKTIENALQKSPKDPKILVMAYEYAMADGDWSKALAYVNNILEIMPDSEKLLQTQGDLYSMKEDYSNSIISYEKLAVKYPKTKYVLTLVNLYLLNNNLDSALNTIEPMYLANPMDKNIVDMYLSTLIAQEKTQEAYIIVKKYELEETPRGYRVLGDKALIDKDYSTAETYFEKALPFDFQSEHSTKQLAQCYVGEKKLIKAEQIYKKMLAENKDNIDAKIGLGYIEIDKRNYNSARNYFNEVLATNSQNNEAQIGLAYSYLEDGASLKALEELNKINNNDEVQLIKAQAYYNMKMYSDTKDTLKGVAHKDADSLKYELKQANAITITPRYSFLIQTLAENFKLDYSKFGTHVAQNIDNNLTVFTEYNIYVYSSGQFGTSLENQLNNVTNELRGGVYGRPKEKLEFKADLGCKFFEFGGGMLNTDSWIKYYFSDSFNLKFGVKRNNVELSYLAAVGFPIDGVFSGRVADNKMYVEYETKLPRKFYSYGRAGVGLMTAQNLETNPYAEALVAVGKVVYNNPQNKFVKKVNLDAVSYNTGYKHNLLNVYNSDGEAFGGYFSPSFFTGNTLNFKAEGEIKKLHLKYGLTGFGGVQCSWSTTFTGLAWGYSPYIAYKLNDHITLNASYTHINYADIQRHYFIVDAVIRGFKKSKK